MGTVSSGTTADTKSTKGQKAGKGNKMKNTKANIYAAHGIEYKAGKILSPLGWIRPLLIDGNAKIGRGAWHFSTLPTNQIFDVVVNGMSYSVRGTCCCNCVGCYATKGNYRFQSVKNALGMRTILIRDHLEFVRRAIMAQIQADKIETVRIHASGDFDSVEYLAMWCTVVRKNPGVTFWTYTKCDWAEKAFDHYSNANIVKSLIPGVGKNYGPAAYVMAAYDKLAGDGKSVTICRCGIDRNQHCTNCKGCSTNEYVVFLEHSTEYKPENDENFPAFVALVDRIHAAN